jgi:hypothetical protein
MSIGEIPLVPKGEGVYIAKYPKKNSEFIALEVIVEARTCGGLLEGKPPPQVCNISHMFGMMA